MFSALHGYLEREKMGMFPVNSALASGLAVDVNASNTAPLTGGVYGAVFGDVVVASPAQTFTQSGTTPFAITVMKNDRELGWLEQPITSTGPSLLFIMGQVYDESLQIKSIPSIVNSKTGALIATDQFVAAGGTKIAFDGSVAIGAICGITSGQPRVLQAGDAPRLKFLGQVVQRRLSCAVFMIL